jgi:hypothetical protein
VVTSAHHTIIKLEAVVHTLLALIINTPDNISKLEAVVNAASSVVIDDEAVVNTASSVVINASSVTKIRRFR